MIQQSRTEERAREVLARHLGMGTQWLNGHVQLEASAVIAAMIEFASQAAQPAEADGVEVYVAGPVWREVDEEDECWTAEVQFVGGHYVAATVHGGDQKTALERQAVVLAALNATPPAPNDDLRAALEENERMREAITPSGATKAAYHGEFHFETEAGVSDAGIEQYRKVYVPWDTVKQIMAAIRARAALKENRRG